MRAFSTTQNRNDALGRLTGTTSGLGAFTFGWQAKSGRLAQIDTVVPGATVAGLRTSFTYGTAAQGRRLSGIIHQEADAAAQWSTLSQHGYLYDTQGRLSSWQQWAAGAQRTWALTQDSDDQLTGVQESDAGSTPAGSFAYAYDLAGNRTTATRTTPTDGTVNRQWTANGLNQLTAQTAGPEDGTQLTYDADGNILSALRPPNSALTYAWDAENRLVGVSGAFGTVTWAYDAFDRRVKQTDTAPGGTPQVRDLIWEGLAIIESRDQTTGETRRYYGSGEERIADIQNPASSLRLYYTTDHLGSIREVVDGAGAIRARYDYDPWGQRSANQITSNSLETDFGFTGHYTHAGSGIILAPYRAYDPALGRWLSRDPIEEEGGINFYGYVANAPGNYVDPDGLALIQSSPTDQWPVHVHPNGYGRAKPAYSLEIDNAGRLTLCQKGKHPFPQDAAEDFAKRMKDPDFVKQARELTALGHRASKTDASRRRWESLGRAIRQYARRAGNALLKVGKVAGSTVLMAAESAAETAFGSPGQQGPGTM